MSNKYKFFVSIIIPIYNAENTIHSCIKSILNQKLDKSFFEIIIINDFSNDNTAKILKNYIKIHRNIKIIHNKKNIGPGLSRNKGLKISQGKYALFVDSDDKIQSNCLNELHNSCKKENYDLISFNFSYDKPYDSKIKIRKDFKFYSSVKHILIKNFIKGEINGSVIFNLIKLSLINKNNIKFPKYLHEDIPFIFKTLIKAKKIKIINKILYIKKNRKNSIVNSISHRRIYGLTQAWQDLIKFFPNSKLERKYIKSFARGYNGIIGNLILFNFQFVKIKKNRLSNLRYLYLIIKNEKKIIMLNCVSKKDKIANIFINYFKLNIFDIKNLINFEKKLRSLKLV